MKIVVRRLTALIILLSIFLCSIGTYAENSFWAPAPVSDPVPSEDWLDLEEEDILLEETLADNVLIAKTIREESLFIASDRHDNNFQPNTGKLPRVLTQANNWLKSNRNGGIEAVCLAGDNVAGGGSSEATHPFSTYQLDEEIISALPNLTASDTFYTYGSRDGAATDIDTAFLNRGNCAACVERDSYYIYGVDYMDVIDYRTGKPSADKFLSWAKNAKPSKPVIMVSHVPLHANRGDQTCAQTWVNTINTAVDQYGLDIIFVFGHNHTTEGGNEIYKEKGTTLSIQKDNTNGAIEFSSGRVDGVNMTLKFTYLNGGYLLGGKQTTANNAEGTTYTVDTAGKKLYIDRFNLSGHMNTKTVTLTGGGSQPPSGKTYSVSVNSPTNGTVQLSAATAAEGSDVTLTLNPDSGYELDTLKDNNADVTSQVTNGVYTIRSIGTDHSMNVAFKQKTADSEVNYTEVAGFSAGGTYAIAVHSGSNWYLLGTLDGMPKSVAMSYGDGTLTDVPENALWEVDNYLDGFSLYNKASGKYLEYSKSETVSYTLQLNSTITNTEKYWTTIGTIGDAKIVEKPDDSGSSIKCAVST